MSVLTIGALAAAAGTNPKTVRYYEEIGLLPRPDRQANGYRQYPRAAVDRLRFVLRARRLGFAVDEVRDLLALWDDRDRASRDVRELALARIAELDRRMAGLAAMRRTLAHLVETCHGDGRPDCPILDDLADPHEDDAGLHDDGAGDQFGAAGASDRHTSHDPV
ncbi:MerR family DNA-binding protein [Tistrella sp. BH-R2-4]|uniref:MerR family DNA-binding protein n=1 Tax=Tistrella arctica TaxID=3133430 RepID=A0ABU9YER8_9PROT